MFKRLFMVFLLISFLLLPIQTFGREEKSKEEVAVIQMVKNHEFEIRKNMKELGINQEVEEKLVQKLKSGKLLDSMKHQELTLRGNLRNAERQEKFFTFQDGSRAKVVLGEAKPLGCGSGYCTYTREVAGFSSFPTNAEYMATYTYVNQGYDIIENVYNTLFRAGAGSVTDKQNAVVSQRVENSNKWARAYCSWTWVSYGGAFSYDHVLRFFVGKDTYSVSLVY